MFQLITMTTEHVFGQWLKQRRKVLDLTQREVAQRIGCAVVTIQKIEEGERRPSKQVAQLLAEHLQIAAEEREQFLHTARQGVAIGVKPMAKASVMAAPVHLPNPLTPLIGRETELAAVRALLARDDVRLVTLIGPPGVGKSRLSIAVGHAIHQAAGSPQFPDGVWFAPLATVDDPARVIAAIAHTLGLTESGAASMQASLVEHLRRRAILLVLDNFEQIIETAPQVAELLIACPHVKALVTSRVPLRVRGEHEVAVEPFALPALTGAHLTPDTLRDYPALALFEARVQSFQPAFALSEENARTVTEICARLDGLPLAIELAAARLRQFSLAQLAEHLQRPQAGSLNLLTDGARDLPARHQTLRAAIAWSYDLLAPAAQQLFARLGVFVGGFDYRAAIAVAGDANAEKGHPHQSLLANLQSLLDQNLLQPHAENGALRFLMLETIGAFALEQLHRVGEETATRQAHAHYFLTFAETAAGHMQDEQKKPWLDKTERDQDNVRGALKWLITHEPDGALRLAAALREFWYTRGYFSEGRTWLAQVLVLESPPSQARAAALLAAGQLAQNQGEYTAALRNLEESIALFRELDDPAGQAEALREYGWTLYNMHSRAEAIAQFEESLRLFRTVGDQAKIATVLVSLVHVMGLHTAEEGVVRSYLQESLMIFRQLKRAEDMAFALTRQSELETLLGDYAAAITLLTEALTLLHELGAKRGIAWALEALGDVERLQGDRILARSHLDDALGLFQELGDRDGVMITLHHLAQVDRLDGHLEAAIHGYTQSLALCQALDNKHMTARCLAGLGGVALAQARPAVATARLAVAHRLFNELPPFLAPGDQAEYDALVCAARAALGEAAFTQQWGEGMVLTPIQALEIASI